MPIPQFREDGRLPVGHHSGTWEEIVAVFGGADRSRRAVLTGKLLELRDALRSYHITGVMVLDGSYISAKPEPGDFDVLLIGPPDIQIRKDEDPTLSTLLDAEIAENERGCSLYYTPANSPMITFLYTMFDFSKDNIPKGIVEVSL